MYINSFFWQLVTRALCREIVYCGRSLCNQTQNASGSLPGMCYGCEKCLECSWTCVYKVVYSGSRGLVIVVEQSSAEVLAITCSAACLISSAGYTWCQQQCLFREDNDIKW